MSMKFDEPTCSKYTAQATFDNQFAREILFYFKPLDELLKCHICFEYYNTCMITKCCHTFCSLCIRKYMTYKAQCPECFQETTEPELRINRRIDDIIQIYHKVRAFVQSHVESESGSTDVSFSDNSSFFDDTEVPAVPSQLNNTFQRTEFKAGAVEAALHQENIVPNVKVPCPVCSIMVIPERINVHLDRCLADQGKPMTPSKRKAMPKVVYHLLSDKDIKKRLKDQCLSTVGNRQSLIKRHKNFILLYNSECDKVNPRPVSEILKQVENEEAEIQKVEPAKLFQSGKKSNPVVIQEENEQYAKQHQNQFDQLISDVRNRQLRDMTIKSNQAKSEKNDNECCSENQYHSVDLNFSELGNQSPDLFDGSPPEEQGEDSQSIDFLVDTVAETDDLDTSGLAFDMNSSDTLDDFVTTKSRVLKRKITNRNSSSAEEQN